MKFQLILSGCLIRFQELNAILNDVIAVLAVIS